MSTQVSGTPGTHQCMQSCPYTATASFFPSHVAGWPSALNSLMYVRFTSRIPDPASASWITKFTVLASLFTPPNRGSNHESSCTQQDENVKKILKKNHK